MTDSNLYEDYLNGSLSRDAMYDIVPERIVGSVVHQEISDRTVPSIFRKIDGLLGRSKLDLLIGGPPCQAYSLVGRSRDDTGMKGDHRNYLYFKYARFLGRYKPLYFVFENVVGLLSADDDDGMLHFGAMRDLFAKLGYQTEYRVLSARNYGVLQNRKRVFLVGRLGNAADFFPEPDKWETSSTVEEVFCDLPELKAGSGDPGPCDTKPYLGTWQYEAGIRDSDLPVTWHQARPHSDRDLEIYKFAVSLWNSEKARLKYDNLPDQLKTHKNRKSFKDRFKVVASDLPSSQTVVAHIAKDGHYYIHPDIEQNRSITPREAARLQTFPDNYFFESASGVPARTPAFSQIGNAVPVLLARSIAEKLKEIWH